MKKPLLLLTMIALFAQWANAQSTYTWIGATGALWQTATNWNPHRTSPSPNDILLFNDGRTVTIAEVPTQTVGQILVTAGTRITLQAIAASTITIAGGTGEDLVVGPGSELNLFGNFACTLSVSAGATGSIEGGMTFSATTTTAHRLLSPSAGAVVFQSGSVFTTGASFGGSPFGTTSHNSVHFSSGSTFIHISGSNPFGASQPASVVVFQPGSLYRHQTTGSPSFSGRTYANFEYDHTGMTTAAGTAAVSIDNFTVVRGTFNFNTTGTPGHSIRGNITVNTGAILNFSPTSAGTVNLSGTAAQTISGGGTFTAGSHSTLNITNPAGIIVNNPLAAFHNLTIASGSALTINPTRRLTVSGTLTNNAGNGGLILQSDASLRHSTDGVAATMERNFAGTAQWRLVSSPVANQAISGPWTPATPNHGYDFYEWDESAATWRNQKVLANNITTFAPGQGYLVSFQAANPTQSFTGPLNNGNVTVPVVRQNTGGHAGANLLGNPYPSAIDWNLAPRALFADDFAYVWDPTAGGGGAYITVNGAATGAFISPNQGFFVIKATPGPDNFIFTNAMRVHGGTFKTAPANPTVSITLQQGEFYDKARIVQQADATTLRERSDALKFFSLNNMMPQVYSLSADAMQLAVNSTPAFDQAAEFVIGILAPATGTYTLRVDGLEQILQGRQAFLLDRVTGASHNLANQPQISFHAMQSGAVDRFVLSFTQPTRIGEQPIDAAKIYYTNGMLHLRFDREDNSRSLQVIDLSGRIVLSKRLVNMGTVVSVPLQLDNGAYIVRIAGEGTAVNQRFWVK